MKILDSTGREITVGADVQGGGRVIGITEAEGDYNSYGRAVRYGPYVKVLWPGGEDRHTCVQERWNDYSTFICEDVVLV